MPIVCGIPTTNFVTVVVAKTVPTAIVIVVVVPVLVSPVTFVVMIAMIAMVFIGTPSGGNASGNRKGSYYNESEPFFRFQGSSSEAMKWVGSSRLAWQS